MIDVQKLEKVGINRMPDHELGPKALSSSPLGKERSAETV
jgi:hypothetical protein